MAKFEYDRLISAEFNLEVIEEQLEDDDPDKTDIRRALRAIDRVARRANNAKA